MLGWKCYVYSHVEFNCQLEKLKALGSDEIGLGNITKCIERVSTTGDCDLDLATTKTDY